MFQSTQLDHAAAEEAMRQQARSHEDFSEVVQKAREILELEGYDPHGSELDLVLHALVSGVEIGLMDSVMAQKVMGFSVGHERVRPS